MVLRFSFLQISHASDVIKAMNSETHSYTASLASLEILAFSGSDCFMILLMLAIGRNLFCWLRELAFAFYYY